MAAAIATGMEVMFSILARGNSYVDVGSVAFAESVALDDALQHSDGGKTAPGNYARVSKPSSSPRSPSVS